MSAGSDELERLLRFVARDDETRYTLDSMGLCLVEDGGAGEWTDCPPPPEGELFADTGGESEYYLRHDSSVALYVPLADTPYVVVGASIREWLALAVDQGFTLDGLAYDWEDGLAELQDEPWRDELDPPEQRLLDELVTQMDLQPWADVPGRLAELRARG